MGVSTGQLAQQDFTVADEDTAVAVGSGSLPVLGTPRLLAWCEAVTCAAVEPSLEPEQTSVGVKVMLEHRAASPVGALVHVCATVSATDGRRVVFVVRATHDDGSEVATGEITRAVVDAERSLARLG
jgi:predicted thioesterase